MVKAWDAVNQCIYDFIGSTVECEKETTWENGHYKLRLQATLQVRIALDENVEGAILYDVDDVGYAYCDPAKDKGGWIVVEMTSREEIEAKLNAILDKLQPKIIRNRT